MENLAYTAKERGLINDAYGAIQRRLETTTYGERQLADALKAAKEGARPTTEAKAHTVAAFARGHAAGDLITADTLDGLARGHVMAVILGAGQAKRRPHDTDLTQITNAAAKADDALSRFLDAIRTRTTNAA